MLCSPVPLLLHWHVKHAGSAGKYRLFFLCIYKVAGILQGILHSDNNTLSVDLSVSIRFLQTAC